MNFDESDGEQVVYLHSYNGSLRFNKKGSNNVFDVYGRVYLKTEYMTKKMPFVS